VTDLVQFAFAALALLIVPGPTNTVLAVAGAGARRAPLPLLAAELAGYLVVILAARFMLLPLIAAAPAVDFAVRVVVIAYLLFVAFRLWVRPPNLATHTPVGPGTVLVTTLLNPKGLIFAASVFPPVNGDLAIYVALFAVTTVATGFAWFVSGRGLARLSGSRAALIPRLGSLVLLVFAALLAVSVAR
jgi:threonine/homoserine/homoserine lactone efflux protein